GALILMWFALALLAAVLWRVQIVQGRRFEKDFTKQSVRRVRLPAIRGRLLDRNGRLLAENRPSFDLVLYLEEIRRVTRRGRTADVVEKMVDDLALKLEIPRRLTREEIEVHIRRRLPLPLTAWADLDEKAVARWAELATGIPGVDLVTSSRRYYPEGALAAHVLGYVGRAEIQEPEQEPEERFHYYLPDQTGRLGIELQYDRELSGEAGGRMVQVDVSGFRHEDLGGRDPVAGLDLMLSLDIDAQRAAEEALGDVSGAAVVIDPRNGEVLALASSPRFDPNAFIPAISTVQWKELLEDDRQPLFHRAMSSAHAPGSTFKAVTALAALQAGVVHPGTVISCGGSFPVGRSVFRCWERAGHGSLRLREAIKYSCNIYFYRAALLCGIEPIARAARELGLGSRTGIDLGGETTGLVPDDAWKRSRMGDGWRDGDSCNVSIGQGALQVSPLQLAALMAALADGGTWRTPHFLLGTRRPGEERFERLPPGPARAIGFSASHIALVREGMRDVVMASDGTGRRSAVPGFSVAGKTGTAEYGRREDRLRRAWMMAFAPFEEPRFAVIVMVDEGVSGGITAAPLVSRILSALLHPPKPSAGEGLGP
ncbi:MAG: penicillin-binding protein 2, partial [Kiritimatiellia bacterium]|nr:penicillin-binding protein 2 [Kiritimatiellia bacterium]